MTYKTKTEIVEGVQIASPIAPVPTVGARTGPGFKFKVDMVARDSEGNVTGRYDNSDDISVKAFAQLIQNNILDTAETIKDTGGTNRSLSVNSAATVPTISAGTNSTAASFTDYQLGTATSGSSGTVAATVNAITSNTFTVTGTITNTSGSTITYTEVGIQVTSATFVFLISHDVFTGLGVSNNGTLAVTYTLTFT